MCKAAPATHLPLQQPLADLGAGSGLGQHRVDLPDTDAEFAERLADATVLGQLGHELQHPVERAKEPAVELCADVDGGDCRRHGL